MEKAAHVESFHPQPVMADSLAGIVAKARTLTAIDLRALFAAALRHGGLSRSETVKELVHRYGLTDEAARDAVAQANLAGQATPGLVPMAFLSGIRIGTVQGQYLERLLDPLATSFVGRHSSLTIDKIQRLWETSLNRLTATAVATGDSSVHHAFVGVLAGMATGRDGVRLLTDAQWHTLTAVPPDRRRNSVNRLLATAYSLTALSSRGLNLGHRYAQLGTPTWRMRAAPWVLPILDADNGASVEALLAAAECRGLGFVEPGENPLPYEDSPEEFKMTIGAVQVLLDRVRRWSDRPLWFEADENGTLQVLLVQDEDYVYAWVGSVGRGVLVAYHPGDDVGYGLESVGVRAALAHALGWFIDTSVSIERQPSGNDRIRRATGNSELAGWTYRPTSAYNKQVVNVAAGCDRPPRAHVVQGHLRTLVTMNPRETSRQRAPQRLQARMGPKDTYVRVHSRGEGTAGDKLRTRLSKRSMLADVVGRYQAASDA